MARWRVELDGTTELLRKLAVGKTDAVKRVGMALYEESWEIFRQSQIEVPYRYGYLAGSGQVHAPVLRNQSVEIQISYGGAAAPYALWVHENRNMSFRNGRKAKYLYDPVMQRVGHLDKNIAARVEDMIRSA